MSWVEHAIWWHVYPFGLCRAPVRKPDTTPGPRLRRLLGWLDCVIELGCFRLLLGPIFESQSHGYDSLDLFSIDTRLGDEADFAGLASQCRDRGLRILLDGVFSHVGEGHLGMKQALAEGPSSPAGELFDTDWQHPGGSRSRMFEGHPSLVHLNHSGQEAVNLVVWVIDHWLDRGIDGWRLDAAYSAPAGFWSKMVRRVWPHHPDVWLLGKMLYGDYCAFVAESGIDPVTQYELWKATWSSINDRNLFELDHTLNRHNQFLDFFALNTFIGNHDVTRIASRVGADGAVTALVVLTAVADTPPIYYGDEQAFTSVKEERVGGDDAIRSALPDSPTGLAPRGQPVLRAHQDSIELRRRHPRLVDARTTALHLENQRIIYRSPATNGSTHLDVEIDLTHSPNALIRGATGRELWHQRS